MLYRSIAVEWNGIEPIVELIIGSEARILWPNGHVDHGFWMIEDDGEIFIDWYDIDFPLELEDIIDTIVNEGDL